MAQTLTFIPWLRSGMYDLATGPTTTGGRLRGQLALTAAVRGTTVSRPGAATFEIAGPGDVEGLTAGAVRRMVPPPFTTDAETTLMVHCELAETDLPWLFTPQQATGRTLRPWIVLVAAAEDEIEIGPQNVATLSGGVLAAHDLSQSARWAHIQVDLNQEIDDAELVTLTPDQLRARIDQHGGRPIVRLLSPRPLAANTAYVAAVVPAFGAGGTNRWSTTDAQVQVPLYHHWRFRTGDAGDFRTLCAALRAERDTGDLGAADVRVDLTVPGAETEIRGAIAPIGGTDAALPAAVTAATAALRSPGTDPRGRPVLGTPTYGSPWHADAPSTDWGGDANDDPRHRGAGGIGLAAGIRLQDTIVDAAVEQIGAIEIANQRLAYLSTGLAASGSLWSRRLPADPGRQIALFWASTARMVTDQGPVLDRISADGRPLPRALFSSAGRRILRSGPARTRLAKPGAADPANVLVAANRCPSVPERVEPGLLHSAVLAKRLGLPEVEELLERDRPKLEGLLEALKTAADRVDDDALKDRLVRLLERLKEPLPVLELIELLKLLEDPKKHREAIMKLIDELLEQREPGTVPDLDAIVDVIPTKSPDRPCRPVDLDKLADDLRSAVDPAGWPKDRVLGTIDGLPDDSAQPVEVCTSIDLPSWRFLRDVAPDWLLPGVAQLVRDRVYAFESNPVFVDAFLLGLNHQTLAELRWRNLRIASGCTPLRVFWGRIAAGGGAPLDDVRSVGLWSDASPLGGAQHRPPGVDASNLILVFRTDLFRRYPSTIVSAITAALDGNGDPDFDEQAAPDGSEPRHWPVFQGSIGDDVTFFGFPFTPQQGEGMWFLLEEPPPGYRFRNDGSPADGPDGAEFARARFNDPTRVLIRGGEIL